MFSCEILISREKKLIKEFIENITNEQLEEINNSIGTLNINNEYYNQTEINFISIPKNYNLYNNHLENKIYKEENCVKSKYSNKLLKNYKEINYLKNNSVYEPDNKLVPLSKSNTYQNEEFKPNTINKISHKNSLKQYNRNEKFRKQTLNTNNNVLKKNEIKPSLKNNYNNNNNIVISKDKTSKKKEYLDNNMKGIRATYID